MSSFRLRRPLVRGLLASAVAATLISAAPAGADTTPAAAVPSLKPLTPLPSASPPPIPVPPPVCLGSEPVTPETLELSNGIAHRYIDLALPVVRGKVFVNQDFHALGDRESEVKTALQDSLDEAFADTRPRLEAVLAHALASHMTAAELRAGARFLNGPGGRYVEQLILQDGAKAEKRPLPPGVAEAWAHLQLTPSGRKFAADTEHSDTLLKGCTSEFVGAFLPTYIVHVTDKVQAAEAVRRSAATDAAPSADSLALGVSVIHGLYAGLDDRIWDAAGKGMQAAFAKSMPAASLQDLPSGWRELMASTFLETLRKDQPAVEQAIGRFLARIYDADELKALAEFTNGPALPWFTRTALAQQSGQPKPPPPPEVQAALDKLTKSEMGKRLGDKLKDKDKLKAAGFDLAFELGPIWLHRFAVEAEEAEAAKRAARGW
jgi:hypothetical protein